MWLYLSIKVTLSRGFFLGGGRRVKFYILRFAWLLAFHLTILYLFILHPPLDLIFIRFTLTASLFVHQLCQSVYYLSVYRLSPKVFFFFFGRKFLNAWWIFFLFHISVDFIQTVIFAFWWWISIWTFNISCGYKQTNQAVFITARLFYLLFFPSSVEVILVSCLNPDCK